MKKEPIIKKNDYVKKKDINEYYNLKNEGHIQLIMGLGIASAFILWTKKIISCDNEFPMLIEFFLPFMLLAVLALIFSSIIKYSEAISIKNEKLRGLKK